jgi:hypothetical protein
MVAKRRTELHDNTIMNRRRVKRLLTLLLRATALREIGVERRLIGLVV